MCALAAGAGSSATMIALLAGAVTGAAVALPVYRWLDARGYRYPDERGFPVRSHHWVLVAIPVVAALCAFGWWDRPAVVGMTAAYGAAMICLSAIDADVRRLPDAVTLPLLVATTGVIVAMGLLAADAGLVGRALLAGLVLGAFYLAQAIFAGGKGMGLGDVKLALSLGMVLGSLSWLHVFVATTLTYLVAAVAAIWLVVFRSAGRRTEIPFGPFMSIGAVALFCAPAVAALIESAW